MALLIIAPLFLAGRHPVGRMVFVVLAITPAMLYCLRQTIHGTRPIRWHRAGWLWTLAIGGVALQFCPLPRTWVNLLATHKSYLLADSGGLLDSGWTTLSVAPVETSVALAVLLGYASLYWVLLQRLTSLDDIRTAAKWIAGVAVAMAVIGLLQRYTSDGRFLWIYEHPFRSGSDFVKGSFANRNHFASFLAMGMGPLLAWLLHDLLVPKQQSTMLDTKAIGKPLLIAGSLVTLLAIVLSFSRGGTAALAVAMTGLLAWLAFKRLLGWRAMSLVVVLAAGLAMLASWQGGDRLGGRLDDLASGSVEELDKSGLRRSIWQANLTATAHGGPFGAGAGTHRLIHTAYLPESTLKPFSHAENSYLQIATESGWWGISLLIAALAAVVFTAARAMRQAADTSSILLVGGLTAGLVVSLIHSLVDFVWFIPACMTVALALLACLVRFVQLTSRKEIAARAPREAWLQGVTITAMSLGVAIHLLWAPMRASSSWDTYLRLAARNDRLDAQQALGQALATPEATADYRQWLAEQMREKLRQVIALDPRDDQAHVRYAESCLREFESRRARSTNRQNLIQIATTCHDVGFTDQNATMDWLGRAFGEDVKLLLTAREHARYAVQLAPVESAAWLVLARLQFLDPQNSMTGDKMLATAQRLAPHDGEVLFELGRQRLLTGDQAGAVEAWKQCFNAAGPYRFRVVEILAGKAPADAFVADFAPDWTTLHAVWERYRAAGDETQLRVLLDYAVAHTDQFESESLAVPPVHAWRRLATMYADLGDDQQALAKLNQAMQCDANQYGVRFDLAQTLMRLEQYAEAEQHFRWCLARRPEITALRHRLEAATQERMKQLRATAQDPGSPRRLH